VVGYENRNPLVLTNFVLAVVHRKEDRCSVPFFHANSKCRLCVGAVVLYAGVDDGSKVCQRKEVLVVVSSFVRISEEARRSSGAARNARLVNDNGDPIPHGIAWARKQKKLRTRGPPAWVL
jgi:hypothetical protein